MASLGPEERAELSRWLDEQRKMIKRLRRTGVDQELIKQLIVLCVDLENRTCHEEALEVIEVALEGLRYVKPPAARQLLGHMIWQSKAVNSALSGHHGDSIEAYEKAIDLGEKGAYADVESKYVAANRRELGSAYWRVGDFSQSLRNLSIAEVVLEEARAFMEEYDYRDGLARLRAAFGLAYLDLGRYGEAAKSAAEAAHLHEQLGEEDPARNLQAAIDYTTLGNALREASVERETDPADALKTFDDALRLLRKTANLRTTLIFDREYTDRESDIYLGRGRTLLYQREYDEALENLERSFGLASDLNEAQHAAEHRLYLGMARARLRKPDAEATLLKAAELAKWYGAPETRWRALYELALLREDNARIDEALEALEECVDTIEGLRSQYLPEPFKISMLGAKEKAYEAAVRNLCRSAAEGPESERQQRILEAFGYAERAKSRVFAEQLAATDIGTVAGVPDKLIAKERELARRLRVLRREHLEGVARGTYDWGEETAEIEGSLRKIRGRMSRTARGREYVALREAASLDYAGVRDLLDGAGLPIEAAGAGAGNGTGVGRVIIAAYFVLDEEVVVFVGRSDLASPELHRVAMPRERLGDWAFAIENTDAESLETWDLGDWQRELGPLVEPLERWSRESDLIWIVPHAELHLLPLHALRVGTRYLAERNPVVYSPSTSVVPYSRAKRAESEGRALVVGDSLPPPNDLPYAREEAEAVAELFDADPLLGERATKPNFEGGLNELRGDLRAVHIACHGEFDRSNPLKSRILLAPSATSESDDGSPDLSAEEVLGLEVRTDLVTLSACVSGVSGRLGGDELIGLTRSFLYAGASSAIVGLWYVADEATSVLMEGFYRAWLNVEGWPELSVTATKATVLQQAQQLVMRTAGYDHPYFWSPFILVGDWR